jgi:hypothetical protein
MVFTSERKRFIIESYFRNGVFNNGERCCLFGRVSVKLFKLKLKQETDVCNQKYFHAWSKFLENKFRLTVRAKVKTKHDRAELRMRALQFTADRGGASYSRQFRGKNSKI